MDQYYEPKEVVLWFYICGDEACEWMSETEADPAELPIVSECPLCGGANIILEKDCFNQ